MKAMFGVVSLLVALGIVGLLAVRQLKASAPGGVASTDRAVGAGLPAPAASSTVREQSVQVQKRVADGVARALEQGTAARAGAIEK